MELLCASPAAPRLMRWNQSNSKDKPIIPSVSSALIVITKLLQEAWLVSMESSTANHTLNNCSKPEESTMTCHQDSLEKMELLREKSRMENDF